MGLRLHSPFAMRCVALDARPFPTLAPCVVRDLVDALGRNAILGLRVAMLRVFIGEALRYQSCEVRMETFGLDMQFTLAMKGGGNERETMDDADSDACYKRLSHSNCNGALQSAVGPAGPCRGSSRSHSRHV